MMTHQYISVAFKVKRVKTNTRGSQKFPKMWGSTVMVGHMATLT